MPTSTIDEAAPNLGPAWAEPPTLHARTAIAPGRVDVTPPPPPPPPADGPGGRGGGGGRDSRKICMNMLPETEDATVWLRATKLFGYSNVTAALNRATQLVRWAIGMLGDERSVRHAVQLHRWMRDEIVAKGGQVMVIDPQGNPRNVGRHLIDDGELPPF